MKLILCLDDNNGYSFNRRRQTRDKSIRQHFIACVEGRNEKLYINDYTNKSFMRDGIESDSIVCRGDEFLNTASENNMWAFSENTDVSAFTDKTDELLIYRWHRTYPRDIVLSDEVFNDFCEISRENIKGKSHEDTECIHYMRVKNEE